MNNIDNLKNLCMLPWVSLETSPSGTARPCCLAIDEITDPSGQPYDLKESTLEEIYHSEYMQNLRKQFLNDEKPKTCNRCWSEEAAGRTSKRMHSKSRLKNWWPIVDWQNVKPDQLWFLDLKLGNICNLKCRICGSWSSSKWAEEEIKIDADIVDKKQHLAYSFLKKGKWPRQSEIFWKHLEVLLPQVKYFEFTGGEPWLIKEHFDLLKSAVNKGLANQIEIHYNTNVTQYPDEYIELWKNFKRVDIAFSVDNVGERFEYERYGANWVVANEIIDQVHDYRKSLNNITTQLCFTINIQNVYYLDELLKWAMTKNFDSIHFNMLHSPDHMGVQSLTEQARMMVLEKLRSMGDFGNLEFRREIKNLDNFISASSGSNGEKFVKFMKKIDSHRKENFAVTHPEIAKAMGYIL